MVNSKKISKLFSIVVTLSALSISQNGFAQSPTAQGVPTKAPVAKPLFVKKNNLPIKVEEMILEPSLTEVKAEDQQEFTVKGGTPPYVFKTSAGFIRYKDNVATYYSPNRPGPASVIVEDARGVRKSVNLSIIAEVPSASAEGN